MNLALVEPFYAGSHRQWCDNLCRFSKHNWKLYSLRGKYWKWRMKGGAIALAEDFAKDELPDAVLATDMLDLALFKSLLPQASHIPFVLYFHENQLMYPWNTDDGNSADRDRHYAFTNYTSALVADRVIFSSAYQMEGFLDALETFLRAFPDNRGLHTVDEIAKRSSLVTVGLGPFPDLKPELKESHTILWNHRHEHDKNPELFFDVLMELSEEGIDFKLIVLGEAYQNSPDVFATAREKLAKHIMHWGMADEGDYFEHLQRATIAPVTSNHDFFGISVLESAAMGVIPVLPKRLVYPEHFGQSSARFYTDREELLATLREVFSSPWELAADTVEVARRYEWARVISRYDDFFGRLS